MKLTTLKPRVQMLPDRIKASGPALSWRTGKTTSERGYTYRWEQARKAFLRANPLCRECERRGYVTPANVADHIEPHRGDQSRFWDEGNWQPLCTPCHNAKAQREGRGQSL